MRRRLFGAVCLCACVPALADTLVVDPGGGGDYTTIQPALDAAVDGDVILVEPGEYAITDALRVPLIPLVLRGTGGAEATIVRRLPTPAGPTNGALSFQGEGFSDPAPLIEGLTLTGQSDSAPGVRVEADAPRAHFKGCVLSGTWGPFQAILSISNGFVVLEDCTVTGGSDAGISLDQGCNLTVTRCTVSDNGGTGIGSTETTRIRLDRTVISGNAKGISAYDECHITAEYCTFSGNAGPAITTDDCRLELLACTITQNGTGLRPTYAGDVRVESCLIAGNSGSGVHSIFAFPELVNCTIADNASMEGGGVAWQYDYAPVLRNSIVWGNAGGSLVPLEDTQSQIQVSYSIVEGDPVWPGEGNRNDDPLFVGGGDYRLQAGSPAVDHGTATDAPVLDLDGYARPCGEGVDLGAYERGSCLPVALHVLGAEPDPVVQDGHAVAYIGSVTFPPGAASVLESLRFRDVGRGNVAALVSSARLYVDDGDGVFTEADGPLGAAADFGPLPQEALLDGLAYAGDPESTLTYFLVCDLVIEETSSAALPVALVAALLLSLVGMKGRRMAWLLPLALLVGTMGFLAPVGCGGDGGNDPVAPPSRELQLELVELEMLGPTGLQADVDGLPSTAWTFEG